MGKPRIALLLLLSAATASWTVSDARVWPLGWVWLWPVFLVLDRQGLSWKARLGWGLGFVVGLAQFGFPYATRTAYRHLAGDHPLQAWLMGTSLGLSTSLRYLLFFAMARNLGGPLRRTLRWAAWWCLGELVIWQMMPVYGSLHVLGDSCFVQWAEVVGAPGLSMLWFCISLGLYDALRGRRVGLLWVGLGLLLHLTGWQRLQSWRAVSLAAPVHRIAVVQGNMPANLAPQLEVAQSCKTRMVELTRAFLGTLPQPPELVVWPEASLPLLEYTRLAGPGAASQLVMTDYESTPQGRFVLARLLDAQDLSLGCYRKRKLILMGEWTPWSPATNLQVGTQDVLLPTAAGPALPLVCFEALWPGFVARFQRNTQFRARWLVHMGSEASFDSPLACQQSLNLARLRAIELRRPVVRASNCGISGWIDVAGGLHQETATFTTQAELLEVRVPEQAGWTLYGWLGDLPLGLVILLALGLSEGSLGRNSGLPGKAPCCL